MIFFIVIPVIIIWLIAFPLIIFYLLRKHRNDLNSASVLIKYGIFFIGLKDKYFFWEIIVINIRKILITVISVSMTT
jgi:hypothetical protein